MTLVSQTTLAKKRNSFHLNFPSSSPFSAKETIFNDILPFSEKEGWVDPKIAAAVLKVFPPLEKCGKVRVGESKKEKEKKRGRGGGS